jgi:Uma2 family endonuclease
MPVTVTETPSRPIDQGPRRKRWTRSECAALEATGMFDQQRLELIEGELIDKMGQKRPHVNSLTLVAGWLMQAFGGRYVNLAAPIDVSPEDNPTNEPQPDLIVLRPDFAAFRSATPQPQDLRLVVEIADTTLSFDLTIKAALYARAGIVEYWILDIPGRRLLVHRDPRAGQYRSVVAYGELETVAPLSAPDSPFRIADAFPE